MFKHPIFYFFVFISLLFTACFAGKKATSPANDIQLLKQYMTGSFNSAEQASADSSYFDITLHMYPIWEDQPGHWLYVEQAVTSNQAKPYRQRVYELNETAGGFIESKVYTLAEPALYVGAWDKENGFDGLDFKDIRLKEGCAVRLKELEKGIYAGTTGVKTCPSELRGANYATSKVSVYSDKIVSWDQGFNKEGEQVWGAVKGGYVFQKLNTNK